MVLLWSDVDNLLYIYMPFFFFLQSDVRSERNGTRHVAKATDKLLESLSSVAVEVITVWFN